MADKSESGETVTCTVTSSPLCAATLLTPNCTGMLVPRVAAKVTAPTLTSMQMDSRIANSFLEDSLGFIYTPAF